MEHDSSKLRRCGTTLAASARGVRPRDFPAHKQRDGFILTGSLLHQAKEIARCSDCCILHLLNDIAWSDTLAIRLGLVIDRHDRYAVRIPEGDGLARRVGDGRPLIPKALARAGAISCTCVPIQPRGERSRRWRSTWFNTEDELAKPNPIEPSSFVVVTGVV